MGATRVYVCHMRTPSPPMQRFMRHVDKVGSDSGCWIWTGVTSGSNAKYGYFRAGTTSDQPKVPAHRWLYEQLVGAIPDGAELDHVLERGCTSKLCVNPAHLEPVSHAENQRRARLTVCRSGRHDLTDPANVRWDKKGRRRGCKLCHRENARARSRRVKGSL